MESVIYFMRHKSLIVLAVMIAILFTFSAAVTSADDISVRSHENCTGKLTSSLTAGPYYKTGSPERSTLIEHGVQGTALVITGTVFNRDCKPISGAWLDFWQADGYGEYDNDGYGLRGHQYADKDGRYRLETVRPYQYLFRAAHVHVKVRANENSPVITTQLFCKFFREG